MTELCVRCSASDDMERLMIGKLKMRNGSQYTSKLEGMYVELWTILYNRVYSVGMMNDLLVGVNHQPEFDQHCAITNRLSNTEFQVFCRN